MNPNQDKSSPVTLRSEGYSDLSFITAPKYLKHIKKVATEGLLSPLSKPTSYILTEGFAVTSFVEALSTVEKILALDIAPIALQTFRKTFFEKLDSTGGNFDWVVPDAIAQSAHMSSSSRVIHAHPIDKNLWCVKAGEGVISKAAHKSLQHPPFIIGAQNTFFLKPIPQTLGAKAFATCAVTGLLRQELGAVQECKETSDSSSIGFIFRGQAFEVSSSMYSWRPEICNSNNSLLIFPCCGHELPVHQRESLVVNVALSKYTCPSNLDDLHSLNETVSEAARHIQDMLTTAFCESSTSRICSLSEIPSRKARQFN
jgi:hypothetical protein